MSGFELHIAGGAAAEASQVLANWLGSVAAADGGISFIWIGLGALLLVIFALVVRSLIAKRPPELEADEAAALEAEEAEEAAEDEDRDDQRLSLKELKKARAAKVAKELSRDELLRARQARKGGSRAAGEAAVADDEAQADEAEAGVAPAPAPGDEGSPAGAERLHLVEGEAEEAASAEEVVSAQEAAEVEADSSGAPGVTGVTPASKKKTTHTAFEPLPKVEFKPLPKVELKPLPKVELKPGKPAVGKAPPPEAEELAEEPAVAPAEPVAEPAQLAEEEGRLPEEIEPVEPAAPPPEPEPARKTLREGLEKTRSSGFVGRLKGLFSRKKKLDEDLFEELEEVLFTADIGVKVSQQLLEVVQDHLSQNGVTSDAVWELLRKETARILKGSQRALEIGDERPYVILVIGVNGVGKTTTIGKLASRFKKEGLTVLMVAGDTFRAAATEQLEVWGRRTDCEVFTGPEGRDPPSVVFDALKRADEGEFDVVLVDTAGRLHTKVNLVEELKKVCRVSGKALKGAPHEVLLVLDSNTGQNAINQAQMFSQEVGVTGIALTKLDGTAKGGVVIGISDELNVPVQFIGIGEQLEDLRVFNADEFVEAIFDPLDRS